MNPKNCLITIASLTLVITTVALSGERGAAPPNATDIVVEAQAADEPVDLPAVAPSRDLELANAALDSRDFVLAEHYVQRLVSQGADLEATVELIMRLAVAKSDSIISSRDWDDIRVFKRQCDEATSVTQEAILVMNDFLQREAAVSSSQDRAVNFLRDAIKQLEAHKTGLAARRRAGFGAFGNKMLYEAQMVFAQGKGGFFENDDETEFQNALEMIQWCWAIAEELPAEIRARLFDFQTQIKDELSEAEFNETLNRFRIVAGTVR